MQPLASLQALADPIYEAFYGLKEQPFAITTDPKFFYLSASHLRALQELIGGLRRREAILLLTGETGTGKTTMCRTVIRALGERTSAAMILNPYMTGPEIFRVILRDFGAIDTDELQRGVLATADLSQLIDRLETFLNEQSDGHAIVVLDEAQSMAPAVLDQIRLLAAFERDGQRLVQIIVCGQPTLHTALKSEALHAFNERITRRVLLSPLPTTEVEAYIQHRLQVAGATDGVRFDADAARMIAELSRGLPRRVNVLCDRALQEGRVDGATVITRDLIKRAAKSLAGMPPVTSAAAAPAGTAGAARASTARPAPPASLGPLPPLFVPYSPAQAAAPPQSAPAPAPPVDPPAPPAPVAPPVSGIFAQPAFAAPAAPEPAAPITTSPFAHVAAPPASSAPIVTADRLAQPPASPGPLELHSAEPASIFASAAANPSPAFAPPSGSTGVAAVTPGTASVFGQFAATEPVAARTQLEPSTGPVGAPLARGGAAAEPAAPALPVPPAPASAPERVPALSPTPAASHLAPGSAGKAAPAWSGTSAAEPPFAPVLPADSATLQPTLRLSDSLDADEAITSSGSSRLRIYVGTAILLIVAVAYVLYAQHVLAIGPAAPALPPAPEKSVGAAAEPVPVPSDDEVELLLNTMRFFGGGGSGQLPRNRD